MLVSKYNNIVNPPEKKVSPGLLVSHVIPQAHQGHLSTVPKLAVVERLNCYS